MPRVAAAVRASVWTGETMGTWQQRDAVPFALKGVFKAFVLAFGLSAAPLMGALAAYQGVIWSDHYTGFAIGGYDPVAYFVDKDARPGTACCEAEWGGVSWRFVNQGNRAAFLEAPSVYAPRFGGHDALSLARGAFAAGDPEIWAVWDGELYLFRSAANRAVWLMDPTAFKEKAAGNWRARYPE